MLLIIVFSYEHSSFYGDEDSDLFSFLPLFHSNLKKKNSCNQFIPTVLWTYPKYGRPRADGKGPDFLDMMNHYFAQFMQPL